MTRRNKDIGDWGEMQAVEFLKRQGFKIIEQNYYTPVGEIDIVAKIRDDIYFIEVKTRTQEHMANDLSITPSKIRKFKKTVSHYCYKRNIKDVGLVVAGLIVYVNKQEKKVRFRLFTIDF